MFKARLVLAMAIGILMASASVASANHIIDADINADCDSYEISILWSSYKVCTAVYSLTLTPLAADQSPVVVSGDFEVPVCRFECVQLGIPLVFASIWGRELCGSFTVKGSVALVYNGEIQNEVAFQEVSITCDCGTAFCPRTPGYWKNHSEAWPVTHLIIGARDYSQEELLSMLNRPVRGNADIILIKHLIAAKLNMYAGADTGSIDDTIANADRYLARGVYNAGKAEDFKDILDDFNNSGDCD